jgi:hypothetical protein
MLVDVTVRSGSSFARRVLAGSVVAVAALAWAPGCIFFVGDTGNLETSMCNFQGETTPCGVCVITNCEAQLNACCTDSSCQGSLSNLDGCATGSSVACGELTEGDILGLTDAAYAALGACVSKSCSTTCTGSSSSGDGGVPVGPTIGISCSNPVQGECSCEYTDDGTTSVSCSTSIGQNIICCADTGYPGTSGPAEDGTTCICNPFYCEEDGEGNCACASQMGIITGTSTSGCSENGSNTCCVTNEGVCECMPGNSGCGSAMEVSSCSIENTGCSFAISVSSCSSP